MVENEASPYMREPLHHRPLTELNTLLDDRAVAAITGRARSTLQKDRLAGGGIPFVRVGRLVRYRPADLAAWLASLPTLRSTSEESSAAS